MSNANYAGATPPNEQADRDHARIVISNRVSDALRQIFTGYGLRTPDDGSDIPLEKDFRLIMATEEDAQRIAAALDAACEEKGVYSGAADRIRSDGEVVIIPDEVALKKEFHSILKDKPEVFVDALTKTPGRVDGGRDAGRPIIGRARSPHLPNETSSDGPSR